MPSQAEYQQILENSQGGILEMAVETRSGVAKLCAEARRRMLRERNKLTTEISNRWKSEFAKIKKENDEWQKALNAAFQLETQMVAERSGDMIEGLQK